MSKRPSWSLLILNSASSLPTKFISLRNFPFFLVLLIGLSISGGYGLVRLVWKASSYAYTSFGVENEKRENMKLMKTLSLFEKLSDMHDRKFSTLVEFEDKTRMQFGMNQISGDVRKAGIGGKPDMQQLVEASLTNSKLLKANHIHGKMEGLIRQVQLQKKTFNTMASFVSQQHDIWSQRPSVKPCKGRYTSGFGYRIHPVFHTRMFHEGVDIANKVWTPIYATAGGIATFVGWKRDFGNVIELNHHASGYQTVYAHLQETAVVEGQVVKRGTLIGYMGQSGRTTGPHLHYEVRALGRQLNPKDFILDPNIVVD
ncbi:MAG: peptidoglycan DD-metalloendopeptidase family protein [Chitinivibrionales bacterium]|nr:peptidoglycan DD-metalloendopeptidase family protein [Chitinivibrionales bacterium]